MKKKLVFIIIIVLLIIGTSLFFISKLNKENSYVKLRGLSWQERNEMFKEIDFDATIIALDFDTIVEAKTINFYVNVLKEGKKEIAKENEEEILTLKGTDSNIWGTYYVIIDFDNEGNLIISDYYKGFDKMRRYTYDKINLQDYKDKYPIYNFNYEAQKVVKDKKIIASILSNTVDKQIDEKIENVDYSISDYAITISANIE